ncbi:ribosome hibernation-promoting factor, HPF/YfiA family [Luteibaculum oceani]|uniref:Ribosome-associated translation inhibitor RaiA n=1 Tax=Luteibaculum oceani TaxID=1294296 RepID=A0A5C6VEQ2_9FLAO|nr:ribosome-associated translation inhibitor RaiA [Luteibaculum oceani]TXC81628.1 ribosome-associated translation inhibitor RaiA [Luteibaculum oceani]
MEVKVHSIHFDADIKLLNFIEEKVNKLRQFDNKIIASEVFLRLDKAETKENKVAEIKLNVPGKDLFAKKQCKSFEEATDGAVEALRRQLKKHKEKLSTSH